MDFHKRAVKKIRGQGLDSPYDRGDNQLQFALEIWTEDMGNAMNALVDTLYDLGVFAGDIQEGWDDPEIERSVREEVEEVRESARSNVNFMRELLSNLESLL